MILMFAPILAGLLIPPGPEAAEENNTVYKSLLGKNFRLDGVPIEFEPPAIRGEMSAEEQRDALRRIAGSEAKTADLLRRSVTAPHILKVRDQKTERGDLIRRADLWFVVHADLDTIDLDEIARGASKGEPVEAGNMRFEARELTPDELKSLGGEPPAEAESGREWYFRTTGRLLDRIQVEVTDRVVATRSDDAVIVASQADDRGRGEGPLANRWRPIGRGRESPHPYAGGAGYVAIARYKPEPEALVVEAHFAFAEPKAWFDGAPILRSKIGLIAQDRIRGLRRELAKRRGSGR